MNHPHEEISRDVWSALTRPAAVVLVVLGAWSGAIRILGDPWRSLWCGVAAAALAPLLAARVRPHLARRGDGAASRLLLLALLAVQPLAADAAGWTARTAGIFSPVAELLLVAATAVALVPACLVLLPEGAPAPRAGSAVGALLASGAALASGWALAIGAPPVSLTVAAAAILGAPVGARTDPSPTDSARPRAPLAAAATSAAAAAWVLAIPPLAFLAAGPLPHGVVALVAAAALGHGAARAIAPRSAPPPPWCATGLVGLAAAGGLAAALWAPAIDQLARLDRLAWLAPYAPWTAVALLSALPLGLGAGCSHPSPARGVPAGALALGAAGGGGLVLLLADRGAVDLAPRAVVALAALATGGLAVSGSGTSLRRGLGIAAAAVLVAAAAALPRISMTPAAVDLAGRLAERDLAVHGELVEARVLRDGVDRAGPRAAVATSRGTYLYRAGRALPPADAESAAETMTALLPVLAARDAERALVIGLGRGHAVTTLRAAGLSRIRVLDLSPGAGAQVASLGRERADAVASPDVHLDRACALPRLPAARESQDLVVVDLPPPATAGGEAWVDGTLAREVRRVLRPDGWAAFRVATRHLSPDDLAAVIRHTSEAFASATLWLDPLGNADVIILASAAGRRPDALDMSLAMDAAALRPALARTDIRDLADLLSRVAASASVEAVAGRTATASGISWRAAEARLQGRLAVPLVELVGGAESLDELVDLSRLAEDRREALLTQVPGGPLYWAISLRFLDSFIRGEVIESSQWREQLLDLTGDPGRDLAPLVRQTVEAGRSAAVRGRMEEAEALFLLAETFAPGDPSASVELGRLAWSEGDWTGAMGRFDRALEADPDHLVALLGAADCRLRLDRTEEAERLLRHAVSTHPESADALHNLARIHLDRGEPAEALDLLWRAEGRGPGRPEIQFSIGEALFLLALRREEAGGDADDLLDQARQATLRSLAGDRNATTLTLYGQIELMSMNLEAAEQALREAVRDEPTIFDARVGLGETYMAQKRYRSAAVQFQEADRLRPGHQHVQLRLMQLRHLAPDEFDGER